ncbi:hypothetical protein RPMA_25490 [Tardiphaga alba]|uniref:Uncharacterized protein n=1 Tax=Tardiphaga alba TaxID=340268 RepID=A0ABX8AE79_9BRAD|nr:hypothetical protein [Tardiphaga alba]QUS41822.1 hypothetical protein RPMA_25490 [Tardiphaga alba]
MTRRIEFGDSIVPVVTIGTIVIFARVCIRPADAAAILVRAAAAPAAGASIGIDVMMAGLGAAATAAAATCDQRAIGACATRNGLADSMRTAVTALAGQLLSVSRKSEHQRRQQQRTQQRDLRGGAAQPFDHRVTAMCAHATYHDRRAVTSQVTSDSAGIVSWLRLVNAIDIAPYEARNQLMKRNDGSTKRRAGSTNVLRNLQPLHVARKIPNR